MVLRHLCFKVLLKDKSWGGDAKHRDRKEV